MNNKMREFSKKLKEKAMALRTQTGASDYRFQIALTMELIAMELESINWEE